MQELFIPVHVRFVIALGLSLLIGLERESSALIHKGRAYAGVRTYSLIGVYGFGCAWLYNAGVPWMLPVGMLSITALALVGYLAKLKGGHVGWTSEVATVLTFITGALCLISDIWLPLALGIVGTFLLSEKARFEQYVDRLDKTEFLAVVKFLLVTLIILPVLPDQSYTQFNLNPRKIWQIVVLVSSIGFAGYFLTKKFGAKVGLWLSGLLGGIVSSTAVAIASGRIAQNKPEQCANALKASLLASSIMYLRILVLIWFISPVFVEHIWWKMVVLALCGFALSVIGTHVARDNGETHVGTLQNPFEIRPAMVFALLFVVLSVATVLVQKFYGNAGIITLAAIIGISDIDPFILSVISQTTQAESVIVSAILVSMLSNTILKGIYFGFLAKKARVATAWRFGLLAILHIPIILIP